MIFTEPTTLPDALKILEEKDMLPTGLSSAEIREEFDPAIRERSIFSARTTKAEVLAGYREQFGKILSGGTNIATARHEMQEMLKALDYTPEQGFPGDGAHAIPPADKGSLQDLGSNQRVDLVLKTNVQQVGNFGWRTAQMTDSALFWFPCWELVRLAPRRTPRGFRRNKGELVEVPGTDWPSRWEEAGGVFWGDGRMIARKDDKIWTRLGDSTRFKDALDSPVPPFAFSSGYGWRAVPRKECLALGILTADDKVRPVEARMNAGLAASAANLSTEEVRAISQGLKTKVEYGRVKLAASGYDLKTRRYVTGGKA